MGNLLAQALKLQRAEDEARAELEQERVEGNADGGSVRIVLNGLGKAQSVAITGEALAAGRAALEAQILAALRDGEAKAQHVARERISKVRGGLHLPPSL